MIPLRLLIILRPAHTNRERLRLRRRHLPGLRHRVIRLDIIVGERITQMINIDIMQDPRIVVCRATQVVLIFIHAIRLGVGKGHGGTIECGSEAGADVADLVVGGGEGGDAAVEDGGGVRAGELPFGGVVEGQGVGGRVDAAVGVAPGILGVDCEGTGRELLPDLGDVVVGVVVALEVPLAWCELDEVVGAEDAQDLAVGVSDDALVPGTVLLFLQDQSVGDGVHAFGWDSFDCVLVVGLIDEVHCNRHANEVNVADIAEQLQIVICHFAETPLGTVVGWISSRIADRRLNQGRARIDVEIQLVFDRKPYPSHDGFGDRDVDCRATRSVQWDSNRCSDGCVDLGWGWGVVNSLAICLK